MASKITRGNLESFLKCRYKCHLKLAGERGSPGDYELVLRETRDRVRKLATDRLLNAKKEGDVIRGVSATRDVLRRGMALIVDATVDGERMSVCFDALMRVKGCSNLGNFHYAPVLFHETEKPSRDERVYLEILGLILGQVQGKEPRVGIIMHSPDAELRRVKLGSGVDHARRTLKDAEELQATATPPKLILNSHCQVCEFQQRCYAEATTKDDLSLLRGMGQKEIAKYARRGIFTVTQLSCTFRTRRKYKSANQKSQPHQHALQAMAIRDKKVYLLGTPELPDCATRVYFDVEGDPQRRFDYLLGMIVDANGNVERHSFWANNPTDEPRVFQQFLDVIGAYDDFWLYCYGSYDAQFLRRMIKELERPELIQALLPRLFNVLSVIHAHVYLPTYSNGLKDVGRFLGFNWSEATASGIESIAWRRRWEETRSSAFKDMLTTYNMEDCAALKKVTEFIYAAYPRDSQPPDVIGDGFEIARVEAIGARTSRPDWGETAFALADFTFVNERAYFDYQRQRVFVRTSKRLQRIRDRTGTKRWKKNRSVNREVEIFSPCCPVCGGTELARIRKGSLARLAFDLRVTRGGIRKWVTRYRSTWHVCAGCNTRFLPADYLRLEEFCHSLKSWAMYEHVAHRTSLPNIADTIRECFDLPIGHAQAHAFKQILAAYYQPTYERLLENIIGGGLLHLDETEVHVRGAGKGYVWVFTNLEEVVYIYRPSREGEFLHDRLESFRGVLVSDFYAAYDSLRCQQQKCLVHLIRDFNHDIVSHPWDDELKSLASAFGTLLRTIVGTVDRYGLRQRHLGKHRREVDRFFRTTAAATFQSEVADGYRNRLLKYQEKLFTFLNHDGVPWNNNNAEHAVKGFAYYREIADNLYTANGLKHYLVLLSIFQSCKYKGVSFLKFLLSGQTDLDAFCEGDRRRVLPAIEIYLEGTASGRPSRKRL